MAIVYILSNPSFPDWYKIGFTTNLEDRVKRLSKSTSIPLPFEVFYACEVEDEKKVEKQIHDIFSKDRISAKREFFKVDPLIVKKTLEMVATNEVNLSQYTTSSAEELAENDLEIRLQSEFNFASAGISLGEEIHFSGNKAIRAEVFDQTRVKYENQIYDFDVLTKKILRDVMGIQRLQLAAPRWWEYQGDLLVTRKSKLSS